MARSRPAGGDARFDYVSFKELSRTDQSAVRGRYPHKLPQLPDEAYLYPVKKDGRLADARRYISLHDYSARVHDKLELLMWIHRRTKAPMRVDARGYWMDAGEGTREEWVNLSDYTRTELLHLARGLGYGG